MRYTFVFGAILSGLVLVRPTLGQRQGLHQPLPQVTIDQPIVTHHSGSFNGKNVNYSAIVAAFALLYSSVIPAAMLVAVSYVRDRPAANRPLLFAFNGGPIGPSNIIHFGLLGPKRLWLPDDIKADPSPFRVIENSYSLLD